MRQVDVIGVVGEAKLCMNGSHIWCCAGDGDNKEHEVLPLTVTLQSFLLLCSFSVIKFSLE